METLSETQESLSDMDKKISEELPEFLRLIETRHEISEYNTNPALFLTYSKLCNCLKRLKAFYEEGVSPI